MATIFGDTSGNLTGQQKGGKQTIKLPNSEGGFAYGDASIISGNAAGGNDTVVGGNNAANNLIGDAFQLSDNAKGGDDQLIAGNGKFTNLMYGDAVNMINNSQGGNDKLIGGSTMVGDASSMSDHSIGGDDTLIGDQQIPNGLGTVTSIGDAEILNGNTRGGNDTLIGGQNMFGDALGLVEHAIGGNDRLIAKLDTIRMYGDAQDITLSSGALGGSDTFVFAPGAVGNVSIYDFRHTDSDKIDISGFGFDDISDMTFNPLPFNPEVGAPGTEIILGNSGSHINLLGVTTPLVASDFIFKQT